MNETMTSTIVTTELLAGEVDDLKPLVEAFVAAHPSFPFRPDYWVLLREWLLQRLNDNGPIQLVARHGDLIVGYVLGLVQDTGPLIGPGKVGYVSLIVVAPAFRRAGIGSAMWDALKSRYASDGIQVIELFTESGNPVSNAFWERRGFKPLMIRRRLASQSAATDNCSDVGSRSH